MISILWYSFHDIHFMISISWYPYFHDIHISWYPFHDIHLFQLGTFMFSFENSTLPSKFNNFFLLNSQIHNYNTRNAQSFRLPLCRTNTRKFSIYFQGPNFYNSLNSDITSSPSSASFKRKLKEFLLFQYSENDENVKEELGKYPAFWTWWAWSQVHIYYSYRLFLNWWFKLVAKGSWNAIYLGKA